MNSDSGHMSNLTNLETLISLCSSFRDYAPARGDLSVTGLKALMVNAQRSIDDVNIQYSLWKNAVAERGDLFKTLTGISSRVMSAVRASDVPESYMDNVLTIVRTLKGQRAVAITPTLKTDSGSGAPAEDKKRSVSQMSFDSRIGNFKLLLAQLKQMPNYTPNEDDLKISGLQNLLDDMVAKNQNVLTYSIALKTKRNQRNEIFYGDTYGVVDTGLIVKEYVRSIFKSGSPDIKSITGLRFRKVRL